MNELNNIELIKQNLVFPDSDTYYYIQVLERKKEYTKQRHSIPLTSLEGLDRVFPGIKDLCFKFGARAYISLIPRSIKKYTIQLSFAALERIKYENFVNSNFRLCDSVALHPETTKKGGRIWLLDVDDKSQKDEIEEWCKISGIKIKTVIPTFKGYHFLVHTFDLNKLSIPSTMEVRLESGTEFSIKKDANTILYGIS